MDYLTRPTSKNELRKFAKELRSICNVPNTGAFPVLQILDKLTDLFFGCNYEVLEDNNFPDDTMARCQGNDMGGYTIEIRESIYMKAHKGDGASLGFVCHEICHVFLFSKGFTPIYESCFDYKSLRPFESVEWQAKYLVGEVMIPYEESEGMSKQSIIDKYHVSKAYATSRVEMKERGR